MKYSIIINEDDPSIFQQIDLLESLGHTVEIIEVDPTSEILVDVNRPISVIPQIEVKSYAGWKNFNSLNFFTQ